MKRWLMLLGLCLATGYFSSANAQMVASRPDPTPILVSAHPDTQMYVIGQSELGACWVLGNYIPGPYDIRVPFILSGSDTTWINDVIVNGYRTIVPYRETRASIVELAAQLKPAADSSQVVWQRAFDTVNAKMSQDERSFADSLVAELRRQPAVISAEKSGPQNIRLQFQGLPFPFGHDWGKREAPAIQTDRRQTALAYLAHLRKDAALFILQSGPQAYDGKANEWRAAAASIRMGKPMTMGLDRPKVTEELRRPPYALTELRAR